MPEPIERPLGQLFSAIYLDRGSPEMDSERFRLQLTEAFNLLFPKSGHEVLASQVKLQLGVSVRSFSGYGRGIVYAFDEWFSKCAIRDLLDFITLVAKLINEKSRKDAWIARVRSFLDQRNLKYEIDAEGGLHYRIDAAFQHSRELTLSCLHDVAYAAANDELQKCYQYLTGLDLDTKMAVVNMFMAAENVFKLITKTNGNLTSAEAARLLTPMIQRIYGGSDQATIQASTRLVQSFSKWVDSCHPYRHGQQDQSVVAPPIEVAIGLVSLGTDFIRWLVTLPSTPSPSLAT